MSMPQASRLLLRTTSKNGLTCVCAEGPDRLLAEDLKKFFYDFPGSPELLACLRSCRLGGFSNYGLSILRNKKLVLYLPLYRFRLDPAGVFGAQAERLKGTPVEWVKAFLCPNVLAAGVAEADWFAAGVCPHTEKQIVNEAWSAALEGFELIARKLKAQVMVWPNMDRSAMAGDMPMIQLGQFIPIGSNPWARVEVHYKDLNDYLKTLSRNMRRDLRKKMACASSIRAVRIDDPRPWLEKIYCYYQNVIQRSGFCFAVQDRSFFESVCDRVPGAHYVLYFVQDEVMAFNLLIERPGRLIDLYFGMDPVVGRRHNLYFLSWLENIRRCIEAKIPVYDTGFGQERTKARLGARFIPCEHLVKHRNPFLHGLLRYCRRQMSFDWQAIGLYEHYRKAQAPEVRSAEPSKRLVP